MSRIITPGRREDLGGALVRMIDKLAEEASDSPKGHAIVVSGCVRRGRQVAIVAVTGAEPIEKLVRVVRRAFKTV